MSWSEIIDRIRTECPEFATVDHALTSSADYVKPAALLAPLRAKGIPPSVNIPGGYAQDVVTTFGVFIVMDRRQNGLLDMGGADMFDTLQASLQAALVNWQPSGAIQPITYAGGEMAPYGAGVVTWRDDYSLEYELRFT